MTIYISEVEKKDLSKEELKEIIHHLNERCLIYADTLEYIENIIDDLKEDLLHNNKSPIKNKEDTLINYNKILLKIPNLKDDKITGKNIVLKVEVGE